MRKRGHSVYTHGKRKLSDNFMILRNFYLFWQMAIFSCCISSCFCTKKGKKRQYNLTFIPRRAFLHQKGNKKDSNKCQCSNLEEGLNVRKCLSPLIRFQWKNSGQANSAFGIVFISPLKPFYPSTLFTFFTEVVSQDWFPLYLFSLCIQFHIITHHNRLQYIDSDLGGVNFFKWFMRGNYHWAKWRFFKIIFDLTIAAGNTFSFQHQMKDINILSTPIE